MSMADRDGFIWMDGQLVPWREAKVHVLTHTLHYGMGVFEGIRAYKTELGTAIFRLSEHAQRFMQSAHILGMKMPFTASDVQAACVAIIRENHLYEGAYIRPMAYLGAEGMGLRATNLKTHVMVAAWSWGTYLGEDALNHGIRCKVSSIQRHHINATLCRAKANANYLNSMLALNEVANQGYDEAIMLDTQGFVAEGSAENIFILRHGRLISPPLHSVLEGITREAIYHIAQDMNLEIIERNITRDELYIADEAFFTGTAAEVTPIREVDDRTVGNGDRGPITAEIQRRFFDIIYGRNSAYHAWLTVVE